MILFFKSLIKNSLLWWTELILNYYSFSHKYNVLLWVIRLMKSIMIKISDVEKLMLMSDYAQINIINKTTVNKKILKSKVKKVLNCQTIWLRNQQLDVLKSK